MDWYENEFIPRVGKRGAEIIEARGASSAASAANAAIDHVHDWVLGASGAALHGGPAPTAPTASRRGSIVELPGARCAAAATRSSRASRSSDFARAKIDATVDELKEERDAVRELGLI